jgi:tRNA-specific 2-thiouridylase
MALKKTVIVGMSGGVDSSVTAALLKKQGFNVVGVYMKNWSEDFGDYGCTWAEDADDARKVAQVLDIPFYVWNFEKEYREKVVEYFLNEYQQNRTPNPDVMCNSEIKFKVFLDKALKLGADFVATGHYARVKEIRNKNKELSNKEYRLLKGVDPSKDQSYFLYTLNQKQLSRTMFPLGEYKKSEIRKLAKKFKLPNAEKKDSQGICFIGKIDVREFLKAHLKAKAGDIIDQHGNNVGRHDGLPYYTIGQREGIGIGGKGPYYAVGKDIKKNILNVTNDPKDAKLWRREFVVTNLSWTGEEPTFPLTTGVTIRYHHPEYMAEVVRVEGAGVRVVFEEPQRAITEGQAAVFYDKDVLIGGGVISSVL